ncbi:hypothetical protein SPIRO4BDMA_50225 [uncultured spirochete]|uniref:Uncharacterized protein n=1 Tax=uncultured spirochete TaxID=156406 RepID=A0A3P3XR39_9SPIR|nr:hypothetical protein SPIRO4BDMA_50225 [uncultured spirochete]
MQKLVMPNCKISRDHLPFKDITSNDSSNRYIAIITDSNTITKRSTWPNPSIIPYSYTPRKHSTCSNKDTSTKNYIMSYMYQIIELSIFTNYS